MSEDFPLYSVSQLKRRWQLEDVDIAAYVINGLLPAYICPDGDVLEFEPGWRQHFGEPWRFKMKDIVDFEKKHIIPFESGVSRDGVAKDSSRHVDKTGNNTESICQAIAKVLVHWNPKLTRTQLAESFEIREIGGGKHYSKETLKRWFNGIVKTKKGDSAIRKTVFETIDNRILPRLQDILDHEDWNGKSWNIYINQD